MTYEEFLSFVPANCMYETIYDDSDGRSILVIRLLDAYGMVNKARRPWVGLTEIEIVDIEAEELTSASSETFSFARAIEYKLKQKNT